MQMSSQFGWQSLLIEIETWTETETETATATESKTQRESEIEPIEIHFSPAKGLILYAKLTCESALSPSTN